jgi:predicted permease
MTDTRLAIRSIRKHPGFAAAVVLTLALAIGPNSAIFSVVNTVLLKPLPYEDAEELVWITGTRPWTGRSGTTASSWREYERWRTRKDAVAEVAVYFDRSFNLSEAGDPERVSGAVVTPGLFQVLGVKPLVGRAFLAEEASPGAHRVVLLGYGLWHRRFGGDPGILGRQVPLHGELYTVVGVMPEGFRFPQYADAWVPLSIEALGRAETDAFLWGIGRLAPGVDPARAEAALAAAVEPLEEAAPDDYEGVGARVVALREYYVGESGAAAVLFWAATGLVLLIACANVAGLLLARMASRTSEIALRTAMGAGRARLSRQLVLESLVLAFLGGGLGLALGAGGLRLLEVSIPVELPFWADFSLDLRVVAFVVLVSAGVGVALGLTPWVQIRRRELTAALKEGGGQQVVGRRGGRVRNALVVGEIALSIVLLTGAALMGRSLLLLQAEDLGFSTVRVVTFRVDLPGRAYEEPRRRTAFVEEARSQLAAIPSVEEVGAVSALPLQSWFSVSYRVAGEPAGSPEDVETAFTRVVTGGYLEALHIPVVRGRGFTERDTLEASGVVLINQALAERLMTGGDPLGRALRLDGWDRDAEVVGVVADVRQVGTDPTVRPEILQPASQHPPYSLSWVLRTTGDPGAVVAPARRVIAELGSALPIYQVKGLDEVVEEAFWQPRIYAWLLGIFAVIALVLASVGIYGVIAYLVEQRTREIGIRMALGARRSQAVTWVLRQAAFTVGLGALLGALGAAAVARVLGSTLFGVAPAGPLLYLSITVLLSVIACAAVLLPAHRATRVHPASALRLD